VSNSTQAYHDDRNKIVKNQYTIPALAGVVGLDIPHLISVRPPSKPGVNPPMRTRGRYSATGNHHCIRWWGFGKKRFENEFNRILMLLKKIHKKEQN
jgi:hypothetical protein